MKPKKEHKKRHWHSFNGSEYKLSWKYQDHPPTLLGLEASSRTLAILKAADTMLLQSCPKLTEMAKNCPPGKLTLRFEGNTRVKLILGVWDGYFWISTLVEFHYLRFLWYFDSSRKWKSAEQQLKLLLQSIIIYLSQIRFFLSKNRLTLLTQHVFWYKKEPTKWFSES